MTIPWWGWLLAIAFISGVAVYPYHQEQARREGREPLTIIEAGRPANPDAPYVWGFLSRRKSPQSQRSRLPLPGEVLTVEERMLTKAAQETDVPAGILYGLWTERSGRATRGWSPDSSWFRPADLPNSRRFCSGARRAACLERYAAVQSICKQGRLGSGLAICNPNLIRVSPHFRIGSLGHDPLDVVRRRADGSLVWAGYIRDWNGDGVWNPHDLREALLAAGLRLRADHDAAVSRGEDQSYAWHTAIRAYLGSELADRTGRVHGLWGDWCSRPGRCSQ